MIKIDFLKAPNPNYLGERIVFRNQATLGNGGLFSIEKHDLDFPIIKLKIIEKKLVFEAENHNEIIYVNNKKNSLPLTLKKNDVFSFSGFEIRIIDFHKQKYINYKKKLSNLLVSYQKNQSFMKLINNITEQLD